MRAELMNTSSIAEPRTRTSRGTEPEGFRGKLATARKKAPPAEDPESPTPTPTPTPAVVPLPFSQASPISGLEQLKAVFGVVGDKPQKIIAPQADVAPTTPAAPQLPEQTQALSPLDQAVHDLIGQLAEREETRPEGEHVEIDFVPQQANATVVADDVPQHAVKQAAPAREIAQMPEHTNPSHVNLVIENESERVVVTVAVRGNDVNVSLRGSDENTAAALARNAGTLDHALRARGLDLTDFSAERDRDPASQQQRSERDPRREREGDEPFVLEEHA
jgi:hypothetical protein